MVRRRASALLFLGALGGMGVLGGTGCGDLLGLDEKQGDTPADAAADGAPFPPGAEGGGDAAGVDPGQGDATLDDSGGIGAEGGRRDTGTVHPETGATDTGAGDPDSGCSTPGTVPDGAPETFYGSCVTSKVLCNQHGTTGGLAVTPLQLQIQKDNCATLKGVWTDGPCNLAGAVFGCKTIGQSGQVCAPVDISWYYPPASVADEPTSCPASVGTIVLP